ncbi:MAG: hypothetical protein GX448_07230 [Planctomycetes bacterium]|nr:hypothetical protein [Planctomycetota bacterium]
MRAKNLLAILIAVVCVSNLAFGQIIANPEDSADQEIEVHVNPAIAVIATGALVPQAVATGRFDVTAYFTVEANTEAVNMYVMASNLYKGDSAASIYQIPVVGAGAKVAVGLSMHGTGNVGNEVGGAGDNFLEWDGQGLGTDNLNGMDALTTVTGLFESGDNGTFSHPVNVTVTYDQEDYELPVGWYSGWIRLVAVAQPDIVTGGGGTAGR